MEMDKESLYNMWEFTKACGWANQEPKYVLWYVSYSGNGWVHADWIRPEAQGVTGVCAGVCMWWWVCPFVTMAGCMLTGSVQRLRVLQGCVQVCVCDGGCVRLWQWLGACAPILMTWFSPLCSSDLNIHKSIEKVLSPPPPHSKKSNLTQD